MKKNVKSIIIFIIMIILLIVSIKACTASVFDGIADVLEIDKENYNDVIKSYVSPDEKYIAYYFIRDVNATTAKSYQLSIYNSKTSLNNDGGNIFVSSKRFSVKWIDNDKLLIEYNKESEIYLNESKYNGIKIQYKIKN